MSNGKILVVDDEPQLRRVMRVTLTDLGYVVYEAKTGEEAVDAFRSAAPDLVLLDLNMPGGGGLAACREIRSFSDVPIVILSVRNAEQDKVDALDAGADDYVSKPFGVQELLARIRAAFRRMPPASDHPMQVLKTGDFEVDFRQRVATVGGKSVRLTPKEYDLLRLFTSHPNEAIPHRKLLQSVWGPDYGDEIEYLRVFINALRKKLEPTPSEPRYILTEPWVGYRFVLPDR